MEQIIKRDPLREEIELIEAHKAFCCDVADNSATALVTAAATILGWKMTESRLPRIQAFLWEIGLILKKGQNLSEEVFLAYALSLNSIRSIPITLRSDHC